MTEIMPKTRVGIYLDEEIHKALQVLADRETRTISNLVEHLIVESLRQKGIIKTPELPEIELKDK
jgi:hypothetical protein